MVKSEKESIRFIVVYDEENYQVQTWQDQYASLMSLLSDQFQMSGFGICGGGGSCGTCGVEIIENCSGQRKLTLSCEIEINDKLANQIVRF
jgi:Na+-transporting NADH:ubiquinone oxidoreductase subunit NqrF